MPVTHHVISNKEYHADKSAISSSGLKLMMKSPRHYWAKNINPDRTESEPTDAMKFGTLCHTLTLEPEKFNDEFVVMPQGVKKRSNVEKALWQEWKDKHVGKEIITQEDYDSALKIAESVRAHPVARLISIGHGNPEFTLFWDEPVMLDSGEVVQVKCKVRMDWAIIPCHEYPNGLIYDLKTAKDSTPNGFQKDAYNLGYHIQAAFYCRAMQLAYGLDGHPPFIFLAAEKEDPFGVISYVASNEFISAGVFEYKRLLKLYAECMRANSWPCYPETIHELELPTWARNKYV